MKAFVKVNNGTFPNLNFYLAWEAFNTMGYSVTCFEEKDIDTLEVTPETPVFAGVTIFRKIIDKLGVNYPPFDCYPKVLTPHYRRNIRTSTLGEVKKAFAEREYIPVFVKPIKPKVFTGCVLSNMLNLIPIAKVPDDTPVYVCEPMEILSEFRVYVHDGDILGVKHYYGEWDMVPDRSFIENVVRAYRPCPIAYGIDIGVNSDFPKKTPKGDLSWYDSSFVLEVNDGCNLGNYGLDAIHYGEMIVSRWFEIVSTPKIENQMASEITFADECEQKYKYDWAKGRGKEVRDFYSNRWGRKGETGKEIRISEEALKMKQNALKAFAQESLEELRKSEEQDKKL